MAAMKKLKMGGGMDSNSTLGPLISPAAVDRVSPESIFPVSRHAGFNLEMGTKLGPMMMPILSTRTQASASQPDQSFAKRACRPELAIISSESDDRASHQLAPSARSAYLDWHQ